MLLTKIRKAVRALGYARDRRALRYGVVASLEHCSVLKNIPSARTVLDVGANKGQFILEAVKWHPNAYFIAFEPLPGQQALIERVLADVPNLSIHPVALSNERGTVPFHISASSDCSSVLDQTSLQTKSFPGTQNVSLEDVPALRLDQLLDPSQIRSPAICKIDVQGYEMNVLRGFGGLLSVIDYLIVELTNAQFYKGAANSAEVIAFLWQHNFRLLGVYDLYAKRGISLQADFLFARNVELK